MNPHNLVSTGDIAERIGVLPPVVCNWVKRYTHFPKPVVTVARGRLDLYDWPTVKTWHDTYSH